MIKFFRRIRRKLLDEGNLKRYFTYAIGEILLVAIGILLALQVNNWNENRKAEKSEIQTLEIIKANLMSEAERLAFVIRTSKQNILTVENLISGKYDSIKFDQLFNDLTNDHQHKHFNSGYEALVSSNNLELISNQKLRDQLIHFYESDYEIMDAMGSYELLFTTSKMEPYLMQNFPIKLSNIEAPKIINQKLNDDLYFNNLLIKLIVFNKSKIKYMSKAKLTIHEIKELIKNELKE